MLKLGRLELRAIVMVTNTRPSAAVALAARSTPRVPVLVIAPPELRERVADLGALWDDIRPYQNATRQIRALYRHTSADRPEFRLYTLTRWLLLREALRGAGPLGRLPRDAALAVIENDVLLFEDVSKRLAETSQAHPDAEAEVVVNGAYLLASASALARYAAFLWHIYSLPGPALAELAWRFGEPKPLQALSPLARSRIDPGMVPVPPTAATTDSCS